MSEPDTVEVHTCISVSLLQDSREAPLVTLLGQQAYDTAKKLVEAREKADKDA